MVENGLNLLEKILAVLPCLLFCYLIFRIDKFDREPKIWLAGCFFLGMILTFPAVNLELHFANFSEKKSFGEAFFLSFFVIALIEESLKMLALTVPFRHPVFNEPLDGIVYAMMIGMGFATAENLVYAERFGLPTVAVRAFTAVPAHVTFAVFSGYFAGLAKFQTENRLKTWVRGWAAALILHGLYDFFIIFEKYAWLSILGTFGLYGSLFYCLKLIEIHREDSAGRQKTF
jgi:protease PrsW